METQKQHTIRPYKSFRIQILNRGGITVAVADMKVPNAKAEYLRRS